MTNKLRTLLFTLGTTTAVVAPIAAVVACGKSTPTIDASKPFNLDGSGASKSTAHPVWKDLYRAGVKEGYMFKLSGRTITLNAAQASYLNAHKSSQVEFVAHVINLFVDATNTFDSMRTAAGFATSFKHGSITTPTTAAPK